MTNHDFRPDADALRAELAKPIREEPMTTEQDAVAVERVPMQVPSEKTRLTEGIARVIQDEYEAGGTAFDMATAAIREYNAVLRERSRDADVVEAVMYAITAGFVDEQTRREARYALTAALDAILGKEPSE